MGFFDRLRQELIDIVEWVDDAGRTLVWRFPRYRNEIKQGAKLIVRPGQTAIFVWRGQIADTFGPGTYELRTDNLPILSTLAGWKHGFESPIKSEVYFVSTRQITDLKWGTPNPIMLRDPDFGPIRLRAFGTYALKATDPKALLEELVGTDPDFEADEVTEIMRSMIVSTIAELLGESDLAAMDLAANYRTLGETLRQRVAEQIDDEYGLAIPALFVVNISFPEEVEKALDARSSMGVIGDVGRYQQYQMGKAIPDAASNPSGGGAAAGMGLGMGLAMAERLARGLGTPGTPGATSGTPGRTPPPVPGHGPVEILWHVARDGRTEGPFTGEQLRAAIARGELGRSTLVWTAGMSGWTPAGEIQLLAPQTPPPPPPPPPSSSGPGSSS